VDFAPIPTADRPRLMAFLKAHLMGGEPTGNLAQELADISDQGLAALNEQIVAFLGADPAPQPDTSRSGQIVRLAELLDGVAMIDGHQSSRGQATIASSRRDAEGPNDGLRATSEREMDMLAWDKGDRRVTNATLRRMRRTAGWKSVTEFATTNALTFRVDRAADVAHRCRERKIAQFERAGYPHEEAEQRVQKEYIAVTRHHGKALHKRDPYDDSRPRIETDLSPEAIKDVEAELACHPAVLRQQRQSSGWTALHSLADETKNSHTRARVALLCRLQKCAELQADGLSPAEAEARVQDSYMALHRQEAPRRTTVDLSPEAVQDVMATLDEFRLIASERRKPAWSSLNDAANRVGHEHPERLITLVNQLREEEIQKYQSQGMTPDDAEQRVQEEYIAYRPVFKNGILVQRFVDLSPAAFQDFSARLTAGNHGVSGTGMTVASPVWMPVMQVAKELLSSPETVRRYARQCRETKIEELMAAGQTQEEAEQRVQKEYLAMAPYSNGITIHISPEAYQDIAAALQQSRQRPGSGRRGEGAQTPTGHSR
jgi:hypothetical protein